MYRSTVVRNAKIIRRFNEGEAPKDIYLAMNLTSVDVVYDALRPHKRRAVKRALPKIPRRLR
jgi:hypothetical protein